MNLLKILLANGANIVSPILIRRDRRTENGYVWTGKTAVEYQHVQYIFELWMPHDFTDMTEEEAVEHFTLLKIFHLNK